MDTTMQVGPMRFLMRLAMEVFPEPDAPPTPTTMQLEPSRDVRRCLKYWFRTTTLRLSSGSAGELDRAEASPAPATAAASSLEPAVEEALPVRCVVGALASPSPPAGAAALDVAL